MAIPTVHISGHIRGPGGIAPVSGTIRATLSQHASMLDGSESVRVLGERTFKLGPAGAVSIDLEPNDAMTPGRKFSTTTSATRMRSSATARASGRPRSRAIDRFPALTRTK
jgi:hypothetical protein